MSLCFSLPKQDAILRTACAFCRMTLGFLWKFSEDRGDCTSWYTVFPLFFQNLVSTTLIWINSYLAIVVSLNLTLILILTYTMFANNYSQPRLIRPHLISHFTEFVTITWTLPFDGQCLNAVFGHPSEFIIKLCVLLSRIRWDWLCIRTERGIKMYSSSWTTCTIVLNFAIEKVRKKPPIQVSVFLLCSWPL